MQVTHTREAAHWAVTEAGIEIWYNHWASPAAYFTERGSHSTGTVHSDDEMLKRFETIAAEFQKQFDAREKTATTLEDRRKLAEDQWTFFYKLTAVTETDPRTGETRQVLKPDKENSRYPELERILAVPDLRQAFFNMYEMKSGTTPENRKPLSGYAMFTNMADCRTGQYMLGGVMSDTFATQSADEAIQALENLDIDARTAQMSGLQ